jgi:putative tryptophan/tyrosine transport system substrate-binding protein
VRRFPTPKVHHVRYYLTLLFVFALSTPAEAQQTKKVPRIGFLSASSPSSMRARVEKFRQGLHELGYVEGQNIAIEYRYAEGKLDRVLNLAKDLIRLKVDVIVATSDPAVRAAKNAAKTIPIVFVAASDPVGDGFVKSLAQPGGNATGLSNLYPELSAKRLELLKETITKISRVVVLFGSSSSLPDMKEQKIAAQGLGLHLVPLSIEGDIEAAFATVRKEHPDALLTNPSPLINTARERMVEFAAKNHLPAMYAAPEFVDAGGLMSYTPNYAAMFRRAATYVDKILKGARPADLAVEQPTQFELWLNLKTAKRIGLTIPQSVLYRADKVIR